MQGKHVIKFIEYVLIVLTSIMILKNLESIDASPTDNYTAIENRA